MLARRQITKAVQHILYEILMFSAYTLLNQKITLYKKAIEAFSLESVWS